MQLQLLGEPQVHNSLAAAAVAREAGLTVGQIAELLSAATVQSPWRMETTTRADGVTIINDAYNANPNSMRHSLQALAAVARGVGRCTIAVLGRMNELGDDSQAAHEGVGRIAADLGLDQLIVIGGDEARWMQQAAHAVGATTVHMPDQHTALQLLRCTLRSGDVVLIKASRGVELQQLASALLEPDPDPVGA
ncbi:glutamate ligase domain-containing protein [Streptomyces sp. ISL-98]|uniref:glutamate ligase domain-containing protein n=1 Tax=Streptomyces sp. ISL-98 TaxID=2819192 RepID=UPI0027E3F14B|nr:cyanophycin synthetase [Streptomyces sp. ISL-98]